MGEGVAHYWEGLVHYMYVILFGNILSGNNKHDQDAMNETFVLSNIVPQDLDNNSNFWYRLEAYCRSLTKRYSDVYIVSGPLYLPTEEDGKKIVKYQVEYTYMYLKCSWPRCL